MHADLGLALRERSTERFEALHRSSQEIAVLQAAIFEYLGTLRTGLLREEESARIQFLTQAVVTFESIASSIFDKLTRIYDLRARIARGALPEPARGSERG